MKPKPGELWLCDVYYRGWIMTGQFYRTNTGWRQPVNDNRFNPVAGEAIRIRPIKLLRLA